MRGDALHDRTHGEYDIVVWDARGKGLHNLTMCVVVPMSPPDIRLVAAPNVARTALALSVASRTPPREIASTLD